MKKLILTSILAALVALGTTAKAQDYPDEYLGLPGDNLNLYAVMKLFQESETLEGFERNLNSESSRINNLDLNGDNLIDYITVTDYPDGDDHTIVMRVPLGKKDFQDVAVFTVQRFNNGSVQIQLIGDEALYGKNYIIEPNYKETPNPGYMGRPANRTYVTVVETTPYEISYWPLVRFIYMPGYMAWHSSWYWGFYPQWWSPWRPFYWHYYYGYHYNWYNDYYAHYRHWDYCRWNGYNDFYYHGMRHYSPMVAVNIHNDFYRNAYSHPEQKKEGEALYTRTNPNGSRRTPDSRESTKSYTSQRNDQSVRAPQGRSTQSAQAPQGSRSTQSARAPQSSSSTQSARAPQASRSTQSARHHRAAEAPRVQGHRRAAEAPRVQGHPRAVKAPRVQGLLRAAKAPRVQGHPRAAEAPRVQGHPRAAEAPRVQGLLRAAEAPRVQGLLRPAEAVSRADHPLHHLLQGRAPVTRNREAGNDGNRLRATGNRIKIEATRRKLRSLFSVNNFTIKCFLWFNNVFSLIWIAFRKLNSDLVFSGYERGCQ